MKIKGILYALMLLPMLAMATEVKSPNGNVVLTFEVKEGRPTYSVTYKGKDVVRPSHLGFELAKDKHAMGLEERDLLAGFELEKEETTSFDETWQPVWGETRDIRNHYNEYAVSLQQQWQEEAKTDEQGKHVAPRAHQRHMTIRFRVYDDGVGFRYEFPRQAELNYFLIKEERSEFAMAGDHKAWWIPGDYDTQEQETQETRLSEIRGRFRDGGELGQLISGGIL